MSNDWNFGHERIRKVIHADGKGKYRAAKILLNEIDKTDATLRNALQRADSLQDQLSRAPNVM